MTGILLDDAIEHPIQYCISVILKEAKEEMRLVKQLIYVILSAKTNNPLNLAINSPSGEGKNWVLEKVAEKFPSEDVIFLSGMTDKALFHRRGILVVNKNDFDKREPSKYVPLDTLVEDIDSEIEGKQSEIERTKNQDLIKGLKTAVEDLVKQKEVLYANTKKLIDLSHKTLIFLDTPRVNLLTTIMSLLSHDRYEAEYEFVDTHNGIKTYTNILRGWPAVIFAQAIDYTKHERWPELQRRFIVTNPEMNSKKKYAEAVDLALDKNTLPDLVYQKVVSSDEEKDRVKYIVKYIGDEIQLISERIDPGKNSTYVPFSGALKNALPKDKSSDMNTAKRFSGFLSLLPMINIGKRPMIKVHILNKEDGPVMQTIPLALFEDLRESIYLMEYANGVRPYVLEWYYDVFLPTYDKHGGPAYKIKKIRKNEEITIYETRVAVTTQELIAATKDKKSKSFTSDHLLHTFINPLMNQGYIDCIESDLDHRAKIYFPVIATKNTELLKNDTFNILLQPGKVNVKDSTMFPDKAYLISKIEGILKYYSEEGIRWTLCDHENKEISIEGLIERYYDKPDNYFSISEEGQNRNESQGNPSSNEKTTNNGEEESNKILNEPKFSNSVFSTSDSGGKGPYSCPHCDYRHETLDLHKKHIEESHNNNRIADMAAANLSGNSIMGYSSNNSNDTSTCPDG